MTPSDRWSEPWHGRPLIIGVQSKRIDPDRREEIFDAWTGTYMYEHGIPATADNFAKGRDMLLRAYGMERVPDGSVRELRAAPDSLIFRDVLNAPPNNDNIITICVDVTMAWIEQLRPNILRVAFPPPRNPEGPRRRPRPPRS